LFMSGVSRLFFWRCGLGRAVRLVYFPAQN
jgi:hypothetical protein